MCLMVKMHYCSGTKMEYGSFQHSSWWADWIRRVMINNRQFACSWSILLFLHQSVSSLDAYISMDNSIIKRQLPYKNEDHNDSGDVVTSPAVTCSKQLSATDSVEAMMLIWASAFLFHIFLFLTFLIYFLSWFHNWQVSMLCSPKGFLI